ncbi:MAG: hypothetical protein D6832_03550 [Alphaproteobacteria bacterium]|nr:MAG: hypothetical protein D6832_03550 [Alphaproteobacteria bacterium]
MTLALPRRAARSAPGMRPPAPRAAASLSLVELASGNRIGRFGGEDAIRFLARPGHGRAFQAAGERLSLGR